MAIGLRLCVWHVCSVIIIVCLLLPGALSASMLQPAIDVHTHFKWNQREVTTAEQALAYMDAAGLSHAVVIGRPPELTWELKKLAPQRVIPFYSPYRDGLDWYRWRGDPGVVAKTEKALQSGFQGIGELHLIGGFSRKAEDNTVLDQLLQLAVRYNVPLMLHTEYSRPDALLRYCRKHPQARIIWAHAGAILNPELVASSLDACRNVTADLAARDPWRFVNNPITDKDGYLLPDWKQLFIDYADRFMIGSDTVWPVEKLDGWSEPDTGWQELTRFWDFHRSWLAQLPQQVANQIARDNAKEYFKLE